MMIVKSHPIQASCLDYDVLRTNKMAVVNRANITTDIWDKHYALLVANLTDPVTPARSKWIFSGFPKNESIPSIGLPIVIIGTPRIVKNNFLTFSMRECETVTSITYYSTKHETNKALMDSTLEIYRGNYNSLTSDEIRHPLVEDSAFTGTFNAGAQQLRVDGMEVRSYFLYDHA